MDAAPDLRPADQVLLTLVERLSVVGEPREVIYLRSTATLHRWARASFDNVEDEFRYKATWVAKLLRDRFGSPNHDAFREVAASRLTGLRAAAWKLGAAVGYVSLRRVVGRGRRGYRVVLGAMRPLPPRPPGAQGLEAHDAVWLLGPELIH